MARDRVVHIAVATGGAILAGGLAAALAAASWSDHAGLPTGVFSVLIAFLQSVVQLVALDLLLGWFGAGTAFAGVTAVVSVVAGAIVLLAFALCGARIALGQTVLGIDTAWRAAIALAGLIPWLAAAVMSRAAVRKRR